MTASPEKPTGVDVWIVEDNAHFRETVAEIIDLEEGMWCGLAAGSCEEALKRLEGGTVPQVVLMDIGLPGMSGIGQIKSVSPSTQIVVLTVQEDDDTVFEALCAGATGYLLKPGSSKKIVEAVKTAMSGGAPMNAYIARKVLGILTRFAGPRVDYGLTNREQEILELLVEGRSQKQIATALHVSPHTVDTHLRNIYAKLHVHSSTGAVSKALKERLI